MTKAELIERVAVATDVTKKQAEAIVDTVFDSIVRSLKEGQKIELRGFGSFRLRERGAPSVRDGRRGDLVVEVRLMLPRVLDERSKELLREFGTINGENVRESS